MKKIAVVLSGCGVFDGSEIHEATLTLLHICKNGAGYQCAAPDASQFKVVDHATKSEAREKRNIMSESARIARGSVVKIQQINPKDYAALIFPGGHGAALNLCSFGVEGANMKVDPEIVKLILSFHSAKKPIGAICIAPMIVAKALAQVKVNVTIGNDAGTASIINGWGAQHTNCKPDEICFDTKNLVVTTPAYMTAANIAEVDAGIEKLVKKILSL